METQKHIEIFADAGDMGSLKQLRSCLLNDVLIGKTPVSFGIASR